MKTVSVINFLWITSCCIFTSLAQTYPPAAGEPGSTAISVSDPLFTAWATHVTVDRGYLNIADPDFEINGNNRASYGNPEDAVGMPNNRVVSLGDGGVAIATFETPITNGPGYDFAVFENSFNDTYLELAFVEVSSNGIDYFRFPSHSLTQTEAQVGGFGELDPTHLNNLAGKYRSLFGTPFDLDEIEDNPLLNKNHITHVKIIDVVGNIDPEFARYDSFGNEINDPFPTPFESGGFDLDGVGVIHERGLSTGNMLLSELRIFPNPTSDFVYISGISRIDVLKIYSPEGKIVLSLSGIQPEEKIDIQSLNGGIYFVLIEVENRSALFKLIIN